MLKAYSLLVTKIDEGGTFIKHREFYSSQGSESHFAWVLIEKVEHQRNWSCISYVLDDLITPFKLKLIIAFHIYFTKIWILCKRWFRSRKVSKCQKCDNKPSLTASRKKNRNRISNSSENPSSSQWKWCWISRRAKWYSDRRIVR